MSDSKKKKLKVPDILQVVFYGSIFFYMIAFPFMVLLFLFAVFLPPKYGLVKLLLFITPGLLFVIMLSIRGMIRRKKEKQYRDNYISEIMIEDKVFGEMRFEKDNKKNELSCKDFKIPFGTYNPTIRIHAYEEENKELYFRSLEYLYNEQTEIIEIFFKSLLEAYSELTLEDLKEYFDIEWILIQKYGEHFCKDINIDVLNRDSFFEFEGEPPDWIISVWGNPDKGRQFAGEFQNMVVYMDCKTKKICSGFTYLKPF